ncbi:MAG: c-type cytochrome [Gemmatimonadota bacterium]
MKWVALVLTVTLAACAQDEAGDETGADTATTTPAPAPAPTPGPAPAPANLPPGVTSEMVNQGQQVFASTGNCFTCHGQDAKGTALAPNLTDAEWINVDGTYDAIINVVKTGVAQPKQHPAPMPAMGGAQLSDAQVRDVAAYVWSLGGGK